MIKKEDVLHIIKVKLRYLDDARETYNSSELSEIDGYEKACEEIAEAVKELPEIDEYERGFHDGVRSEATRELVEVTGKLVESVMESIRICLSNVDIEAIPVKRHGHWLICSDGYYPYCSECGHRPKEMSKFCEECGADMREEGKK